MPTDWSQTTQAEHRLTASRLTNIDGLKTEIREHLTISQVAEKLGADLQASGDQWRSLCLLHEENSASCYYSDPKGLYNCFGCKVGGDMIDLVERVKHLDFIEALYWLAAEADIDIGAYEHPMSEAEKAEEEFRQWCEVWLIAGGVPNPKRVDHHTAQEFGATLHWKPTEPPAYLRDKLYLCDGVILPWRMPSGRLVGWRVREHEGQPKKVIGTPGDFPLGKTQDTLFGIQVAREYISDHLTLVEGEYDTMALHAAGIKWVAGMGGSTLTDNQMALVESLHIKELTLVFDGDEGGYKAAHAAAEKWWNHPMVFVRIAVCSDGEDPEDVVKAQSEFGWYLLETTSKAALEYLLREKFYERGCNTLTEKLEFVKWVNDNYGAKLRESDQSLVLAEVARWLEIPELDVRDYVRADDSGLCAVDSERVLLGRACRDRSYYIYLRTQLIRDDFFVLKHQRLWEILSDMLIDGQEFDPLTVIARAQGQLPDEYIAGLLELSDANLDWHRDRVADFSLRRSSRDDALTFKDSITDLSRPAEILVGDLTHKVTTKALRKAGATERQLSEQVDRAMETLHERMRNPTEIHGLDLGKQQPRLSRILQGLQPKRLVLVAAVSRVGKSTLLCQWCASLGVHKSIPVDFICLEMDESEILYKLCSHLTGIDSTKISGGRLEPDEAKVVEYAMARIRNSPLHIWTPDGMTGTEFLLYARESIMRRHTRAFLIDYVQLIDPEPGQERENGYVRYGEFGRLCKMKVARAMDVSVICAAQLTRGAADKERPTGEDLADSYALMRHTDVLIILSGKEDSTTLDLFVDKNRQGAGGGLCPMDYNRPIQTFREVEAPKQPEYMIRL